MTPVWVSLIGFEGGLKSRGKGTSIVKVEGSNQHLKCISGSFNDSFNLFPSLFLPVTDSDSDSIHLFGTSPTDIVPTVHAPFDKNVKLIEKATRKRI